MSVYFGRLRGGKLGGFMAGLGFMLPGFLLMREIAASRSPDRGSIAALRRTSLSSVR